MERLLKIGLLGTGLLLILKNQAERFVSNLNYKIQNIHFLQADTLELSINIVNDNPTLPLTLEGITGYLYYRNEAVAMFNRYESFSVPPMSTQVVPVLIKLSYNAIFNNLFEILSTLTADAYFTIKADLKLKGNIKVPIQQDFNIIESGLNAVV